MKKLTFILAFFASALAIAQNNFEGTIKYKITYEELAEQMQSMKSMLPQESTVMVKGEMSRTETPSSMGGTTIIYNSESGDMLTLSNTMGNKFALKSNSNTVEQKLPQVEKTDETKEILGYKCKKVIISTEQGEQEIYYSEDLKHIKTTNTNLKEIDGFPMEIIISSDYFTMIQTVAEIKEEKVKKIKMTVPSDYELKTKEELKQMMNGGGM